MNFYLALNFGFALCNNLRHIIAEAAMATSNEDEMKKWFPGLYRRGTGTKCEKPKLRILCFPPAGCAEDLYSTEGTGLRYEKSALLEWARDNTAEVLAVQYPGRANRKGEAFATTIGDIVKPLHSILCEYCNDDVPFVICAHSVGTWIAYELLQLIISDQKSMRAPEYVFFSAFPSPTIPMKERPWNVNKDLNEEEFKTECRRWNINEIVFTQIWGVYHPMLRSDFTLFDQYTHEDDNKKKFAFPMTVYSATDDGMISEAMCRGWKEHTSQTFEFITIDGHHLFPLDKEQKSVWLKSVAKGLDDVMELIELKAEYEGMGFGRSCA